MSTTHETAAAYKAYVAIEVELQDAKAEAKQQISALQLTGEQASRDARKERIDNNVQKSI